MTDDPLPDGGTDRNRPARLTYAIDDDEKPSTAVVRAVAALTNRRILDLDPLYDVIDPTHIDGVFENADGNQRQIEISFTFNGCAVTITREEIRIHVRDGDSR